MINDFDIPAANPFLFNLVLMNGANVEIDYDEYLPIESLMQLNTKYQAGIYPSEPDYFPDWLINKQIAFQVNGDITSAAAIIHGPGISTVMTNTTITPSGYTVAVRRFTYTPSVPGYYYIHLIIATTSNAYQYISHTFKVSNTLQEDKNLIELGFYSDENVNGFVFDSDIYKAYYTGQWKISQQQRNSSIIDEDVTYLLASKSYNKKSVTITDVDELYYNIIAKQLENTTIYLNGMAYICKEPPDIEYSDKSRLVNVTFELTAKYNNNNINIP